MKQQAPPPFSFSYSRLAGLEFSIEAPASQVLQIGQALNGRIRTPRWRAHLVVGVVALRPLRPRRAGGPSHYRPLADETVAPLYAAQRLAARAVPPRRAISSQRLDALSLIHGLAWEWGQGNGGSDSEFDCGTNSRSARLATDLTMELSSQMVKEFACHN